MFFHKFCLQDRGITEKQNKNLSGRIEETPPLIFFEFFFKKWSFTDFASKTKGSLK